MGRSDPSSGRELCIVDIVQAGYASLLRRTCSAAYASLLRRTCSAATLRRT
jgi:hypothetical protein